MIGAHGLIVRQHVILVAKQEQEHVHTIRITLASHSPKQKVAIFKNAVMIGHRGQIAVRIVKQEQEVVQVDKTTSNRLAKMLWYCFILYSMLPLHVHQVMKYKLFPARIERKVSLTTTLFTKRQSPMLMVIGGHCVSTNQLIGFQQPTNGFLVLPDSELRWENRFLDQPLKIHRVTVDQVSLEMPFTLNSINYNF